MRRAALEREMSRRELRRRGLLPRQLALHAIAMQHEGEDVKAMGNEELAAALAIELQAGGFLDDIDWEKVIELILEYAPVIIQLVITLL